MLYPSELALGKVYLGQDSSLQVGEGERFRVFLPIVVQFQADRGDHALMASAAQVFSVQQAEAAYPVRQGWQEEEDSYPLSWARPSG